MHQHNHQLVRQRRLFNSDRHHHIDAADVSTLQVEDNIKAENRSDDYICPWRFVCPRYLGATAAAEGANSRLTRNSQVSSLQALSGCRPWTSRPQVLTLPVSVIILSELLLLRHLRDTFTDDITSSVWTMLEENVAITCACLPMMWMPLARIFPSFFSLDSGTDSYGSSDARSSELRATSRPRNNWSRLNAYPDTKGSIGMNQTGDSKNRPSEDSTGQILPSCQGGETQYQNATGITKVTEYCVSFSTAKSPSRRIDV